MAEPQKKAPDKFDGPDGPSAEGALQEWAKSIEDLYQKTVNKDPKKDSKPKGGGDA